MTVEEVLHSAVSTRTAQEEDPATRPLLLGLPAWAWALIGLLLGLAATAAVLQISRRSLQAQVQLELTQIAKRSVSRIQRQFDTSGLMLRAMQSAYSLADDIDQSRFEGINANLRSQPLLPGMVAMAFARRQVAGGRPRYIYERVAPFVGNARLLGFDASAQAVNLAALEQARDLDLPAMSVAFDLLQRVPDRRDALGIVVRLPVYAAGPVPVTAAERRQRETGALAVSMRIRPMLLGVLPAEALQHYRVRIADITDAMPRLLYDSAANHAQTHGRDKLESPNNHSSTGTGIVSFGERRWQIALQPLDQTYGDTGLLWVIGMSGGIASLLLAGLLWSVATTRRRAVRIGRQMSARYREGEERFRAVNDLLPALVLLASADDGRIVYANKAAAARLGEDIADDTAHLDALFEDPLLRQRLLEAHGEAQWSNVDAVLQSLNGDRFWATTSIARVRVNERNKLLMVASDISEQRQLTELLSYQASHDTLTELFNRREFERQLQRALFGIRNGEPTRALIYIDLDQFKLINDTSGHLAGDQLLSQLSLVMADQLRGGDVLARLGGDEFGVLAHDTTHEGARVLTERLRSRIESYIHVWEQQSYTISASIGVVMLDSPEQTLAEVMSHADDACYMAKDRGRNRIHFYSGQDDETIRRRGEMKWANRLRWVIEENRLLLDYQEVQPLQDHLPQDAHIELLIRLRDEDGNVILPGAFLPAAERYGMMPLLDRWVIGEAIAHFDQLHVNGRAPGRCSLNLAASTLEDEGLAEYVLDLIEQHGVTPSRLCFEITETEAVRNLARAVRFIDRLRAVGCLVALDDFGAGMSSFGYLKNLPVDVIKIDGSFVRDLDIDPMSRSIINVITEIGHQRGLDVVAEWVANEACAATLRDLGVDYGQGFALHRPERVLYQRVRDV
jgi:diguanylate cyclase (GGDEF)-like protein/PAS domain S-box-containing protein